MSEWKPELGFARSDENYVKREEFEALKQKVELVGKQKARPGQPGPAGQPGHDGPPGLDGRDADCCFARLGRWILRKIPGQP